MRYPGGKNAPGVYQTIINQIPPHRVYLELFAGSAAILRHKRPAEVSYAVDADLRAIAALECPSLEPNVLRVIHADAIQHLASAPIEPDWFVYADPPYLNCKSRSRYRHRLTCRDHGRLLTRLKKLSCPVMISGYPSKLYDQHLTGWRTHRYDVITRGRTMATEVLWMNYPEPTELHDDRYRGADYRDRERIKRRMDTFDRRIGRAPLPELHTMQRRLAAKIAACIAENG